MRNVVFVVLGIACGCDSRLARSGETAAAKSPPPPGSDEVQVQLLLRGSGELSRSVCARKVRRTEAEWRAALTPEQFRVTRQQDTERPFCGAFYDHKVPGLYLCVCCGLPLFASDRKFDSGTGWPSFTAPVSAGNVATRRDASHGMDRTEILCARCDAHLGHVFSDGPAPTGQRHCLNSVALRFVPGTDLGRNEAALPGTVDIATFAAGCFWGVESTFREIKGVVATTVGYTGGTVPGPTYEQVCTGRTGHAEAVEVLFDPEQVSYGELLGVFWSTHNPTTLNRQGPDVGHQYRSAVFYHSPQQQETAKACRDRLQASREFAGKTIVTEIVAATPFYRAEEYHQRYHEKHGGAKCR